MEESESAKLLLVDDDPELCELIQDYLTKQGFDVDCVGNGAAMDAYLAEQPPALVILDLMLPGEDGLSIARRLKAGPGLPIVMLSAQGEDWDRIIGLEVGADDYLNKPFNPRELLARVRAVLRRAQPLAGKDAGLVRFGPFRLDIPARLLSCEDKAVPLTAAEFDLLRVLALNPNEVLDRDHILGRLTGTERSPFDRTIDVRINRLRSKIEPDPAAPTYIKTIRGKGYMFCPGGR